MAKKSKDFLKHWFNVGKDSGKSTMFLVRSTLTGNVMAFYDDEPGGSFETIGRYDLSKPFGKQDGKAI